MKHLTTEMLWGSYFIFDISALLDICKWYFRLRLNSKQEIHLLCIYLVPMIWRSFHVCAAPAAHVRTGVELSHGHCPMTRKLYIWSLSYLEFETSFVPSSGGLPIHPTHSIYYRQAIRNVSLYTLGWGRCNVYFGILPYMTPQKSVWKYCCISFLSGGGGGSLRKISWKRRGLFCLLILEVSVLGVLPPLFGACAEAEHYSREHHSREDHSREHHGREHLLEQSYWALEVSGSKEWKEGAGISVNPSRASTKNRTWSN